MFPEVGAAVPEFMLPACCAAGVAIVLAVGAPPVPGDVAFDAISVGDLVALEHATAIKLPAIDRLARREYRRISMKQYLPCKFARTNNTRCRTPLPSYAMQAMLEPLLIVTKLREISNRRSDSCRIHVDAEHSIATSDAASYRAASGMVRFQL